MTIEVGGRTLTLVRLHAKKTKAEEEDYEEEIELKVIEFEGGVVVPVDGAEVRGTEEFAGFGDGDVGDGLDGGYVTVEDRGASNM